MLRKSIVAAVAVLLLAATPVARSPQVLCEGFLPENDLKIPIMKSASLTGMTESQFNEVLDKVERIYAPVVSAMGGNLKIKRLWTDDTVNASAQRWGSTWILNMYGGLARHEAITQDGFALVVCHELGHHLGGAPKMGGRWASNEGQSDYFSTMKCLRKVFADAGSSGFSRPAAMADPFVAKQCGEKYAGGKERALCKRLAAAGMSVSSLFQIGRGEETTPSFATPDPRVVGSTQDQHPATQCRLDTYFSGALCPKSAYEDVDQGDAAVGTCTRAEGYAWAARPRCWYKPPKAEKAELVKAEISESPLKLPLAYKKEDSAFAALRRMADGSR
ncbi:MAG: hypothetical protein ABIJ96_05615 [Elusimicrobiota bacterium]